MTYHPEVHPIDPDLLDELAEMTGGAWSGATKEEDLSRDLEAILETLERTRMQDIARASRRDHFHPLLVLALLLMAGAFGLRFRWLRRYP